jgi:hypothetical protein
MGPVQDATSITQARNALGVVLKGLRFGAVVQRDFQRVFGDINTNEEVVSVVHDFPSLSIRCLCPWLGASPSISQASKRVFKDIHASGEYIAELLFIIAHPCTYVVFYVLEGVNLCARKACQQLFGLWINSRSCTPNALPRDWCPKGLTGCA